VRGYEYEPDQYVVLTDEELRRANVAATQTIEILEFVDRDEIDPIYFDTPYYIEPQKKGSKSYALLRATLERTGKVGIARVVLRTRQHLAALHVRDGVMVLDLLRYEHEVKRPEKIEVPAGLKQTGLSEREVKMAERLVEGMTGKWDPSRFRDEYRDDVLELVRRKVKSGQTHEVVEPEEKEEPRPRAEVVDLMPLLKQSLETRRGQAGGKRAPARAKSPRTSARERQGKRSA
jgi:DNA end-binding protein Ku